MKKINFITILQRFKPAICAFILLSTLNVWNARGETLVLTFNGSTNAYSLVTTSSSSENTFTQGTITLGYKSCKDGSNSGYHYIQFDKGYGLLYNKTELPGAITNVKVEYRDGTSEKSNLGVKCGSSKMDTRQTSSLDATLTTDGGSYDDCDISEASGYKYFNISIQGGSGNAYGNIQVTRITITYTTVACTADPTNSGASLNGSFNAGGVTSLTNIADVFSCSGSSAGSNCSYSENGFVWSSTASTAGALQKGSSGVTYISGTTPNGSGAFTGTLAGTWSTGVTYYYRSYVKNNGNNIKYYPADGVNSFIPRSVTFNSNGGSSVDTKYVRSGGTVTAPSDPTKTGYTFGGWYTDNGTFESSVNWSSTIDANTTYYAKWTVKTYNITLDREGATTGSTSVTMTYNSSSHTAITAPSKDGYTFGGWWSGDNGTGTMVMNADGVLQANVTNYTGAGGVWTKDATCTLYAKWTVINYSITWMVDGVEWSGKGGSTGADYGTAWSALTLPTAPGSTELTGCGANKFVGWTTHEIETPLDKTSDAAAITTMRNTDLLNSDNKASKTSTYITGATTFYAVFADYAE